MLKQIIHIARIAGSEIMKIYVKSYYSTISLSEKIDRSPVTDADLLSNQIIVFFLTQLTPNIPIISEEQLPEWTECRKWNYFWLIDPLDGTKEFLLRNGEFTVNIAFIRHGEPIMGIIYVPVYNIFYIADNRQAWKITDTGELLNISVKPSQYPIVVMSRTHINSDQQKLHNYLANIKNCKILYVGSSYKFCLIAEGSAQFYPRLTSTKIWDTAAGHAIAVAAGASVYDWYGFPLHYRNINKDFLNPFFQVSLY